MDFVEVMKSFVLSPSEETLAPLQAEIMAAANYDPLVLFESVRLIHKTPEPVWKSILN